MDPSSVCYGARRCCRDQRASRSPGANGKSQSSTFLPTLHINTSTVQYLITNLGMSTNFGAIDFDHLSFPSTLRVDYIRVYQDPNAINIGCDPPDFPTSAYIKEFVSIHLPCSLHYFGLCGQSDIDTDALLNMQVHRGVQQSKPYDVGSGLQPDDSKEQVPWAVLTLSGFSPGFLFALQNRLVRAWILCLFTHILLCCDHSRRGPLSTLSRRTNRRVRPPRHLQPESRRLPVPYIHHERRLRVDRALRKRKRDIMVHPPRRHLERLRPVRPLGDVVPTTPPFRPMRPRLSRRGADVQLRPSPAAAPPRMALLLPVVRLREPVPPFRQELAVRRDRAIPCVPIEQPRGFLVFLARAVGVHLVVRSGVGAAPEVDDDEVARGRALKRECDGGRARPGPLRGRRHGVQFPACREERVERAARDAVGRVVAAVDEDARVEGDRGLWRGAVGDVDVSPFGYGIPGGAGQVH